MPLEILVVMVVGGISAIAVALHLLGKSARVMLTEESARAAWARQFPDCPVKSVSLSADAHAALLCTAEGQGLVWALGADTAARSLKGAHLDATDNGLSIRFDDFTAPKVGVALSPAERKAWRETVNA